MAYGDMEEFADVKCTAETPDAILVEIDGDEHWIPKSQVSEDSEVYEEGGEGKLVITTWIATQKGLV